MKISKHFYLSLMALSLCFSCTKEKMVADYEVVPLPQNVKQDGNVSFTLNGNTKIVYPSGNELLKKNATFLATYIEELTSLKLSVGEGSNATNAIVLTAKLDNENKEAYRLTVGKEKITIDGASEAGNFYGIQTLRKAIPLTVGKSVDIQLPGVTINDYPRFQYRGMHLDISRHFMSVDDVKTYIDMLALHNQNRLHWHLTDDQGWRIEIKKYPELVTIGSKRKETVIGHNTGKYDGKPYGGYYTQEQIKEIVQYAQERYITIIPEIDMPGHMLGALAAYPELGCTGGPYEVWTMWGISENVLCAGKEETFEFVENVLTEIMELFPSKYIHIGGDECPKVRWKDCPHCQARIKSEKLTGDATHPAEHRLQSYFITRVEKFINSKGRQIIGWDEILEGGLAPNATVMSWRGVEGGVEAAKQHHDVIMTPNSYLYFDYYQTTDVTNEPMAIGGYVPVSRVYSFEPFLPSLTEEEAKHIIGVQANLWTEYIPDFKQVQYMTMPRMAALSEVQWTMPEKKNYENFLQRLPHLIGIYDVYGYNYAKHLFDVDAKIVPDTEKGALNVELKCVMGGDIYYTLDGSEPTLSSTKYTAPFELKEDAVISAAVIRPNGTSRVFKEKVTLSKSSMKPIKLLQKPSSGYTFTGATVLVDGMKGSDNYKTGRWLGFQSNDLEAVIDLQEPTEITTMKTSANVVKGDWIMGVTGIEVAVSDDGEQFTTVASEKYPELKENDPDKIYDYELSFDTVKKRYVKVTVKRTPALPEWHSGKGVPAFIFIDEIALY